MSGFWLARDPALVAALLQDARLGVRPPGLAVPAHLQQRALGGVFARWLRMRDDAGHAPAKARLLAALAALPEAEIEDQAQRQVRIAWPAGWDHGIWAISISSMSSLLGLAPIDLAGQQVLLGHLQALASGLAPTATPAQLDAADLACATLLQQLAGSTALPLGLADAEDEQANRLALLWQSYEAGAALLGQGLVALIEQPGRRQPGRVAAWLPELFRQPGVILNTRRFAQVALQIGAVQLRPGDGLLLQLAQHGFGHGAHQCPGQRLALRIAATAIEGLLAQEDLAWPEDWQFLTLPNARIPHRFKQERAG